MHLIGIAETSLLNCAMWYHFLPFYLLSSFLIEIGKKMAVRSSLESKPRNYAAAHLSFRGRSLTNPIAFFHMELAIFLPSKIYRIFYR